MNDLMKGRVQFAFRQLRLGRDRYASNDEDSSSSESDDEESEYEPSEHDESEDGESEDEERWGRRW